MDTKTKNLPKLFRDFLKDWEATYSHAYNYFDLFNYFFPVREYSSKSVQSIWEKFNKEKKKKDKIDFYVHLPYCLSKCDYCISNSAKLESKKELEEYVNLLTETFSDFKKIFSGVEFTNLYFGGGTPSILSEDSLNKVFSSLFSCFNFKKEGEKTCELNPISSSFNKLSLLKENGFNRVSFGVQSFDKGVLNLNNRGYQTKNLVEKAVSDAKKTGFRSINIDLIVGLVGDSKRSLVKSIDRATRLDATSISLYPLQPTISYLDKYFNSDNNKFVAFLKELISSSKGEISRVTRKNQWRISPTRISVSDAFIKNGSWYIKSKLFEERLDHYSADGDNSIFAVGNGSESLIKDRMEYHSIWEKTPGGGFKVFYEGTPNNKISQMLYYISKKMIIDGYISRRDFRSNFGLSFLKKFKENISQLKNLGMIEPSFGDEIHFKDNKSNEPFLHLLFFLEGANAKIASYKKKMKKTNKEKVEKKQKSAVSGNILDGAVAKRNKTSILIKTEIGIEKVLLTSKTKFVVMEISPPNKIISQKKNKYSDLKIGDSVSIILNEKSKDIIALTVRQITDI